MRFLFETCESSESCLLCSVGCGAAQASARTSGTFIGGYSVQSINHVAILSGALFGVFLVWLLSRVPSQFPENKALNLRKERDKTL